MIRKLWLSCVIAALGVMILAMGVTAQELDDEDAELDGPTVLPVTQPVSVTTPFTLTVLIPGDDGPITVEVPIMLRLSMSITLGTNLTPTVATTPTIDILDAETAADEADAATDEDIETIPVATVPATPATPVATPAATATPVPTVAPTPTPEALPTSTPVGTADEATDEEADEAEPTATPVPDEPADEPADEAAEESDEAAGEGAPVTIVPVCPDSRSVISSPGVNQIVSGDVTVTGTAVHENFQYYKIEYAEGADPDNTAEYAFLIDGRVQVSDGALATFDSTELSNGTYTLRLSVVDNTGNFPPPCAVTIVVQN